MNGFHVITDPVLSTRAGLHLGPVTVGIKRLVAPPMTVEELPPIDLILLSHAHMDHFDIRSLRALENKGTHVVTAPHTSEFLRIANYRSVQEVGWNAKVQAGEATVTGLEVKHWGARYRTDTHRGYNGYVVRVGKHQILFAGDTASTHAFRKLPGWVKPELAIFPIGAYNPWIRNHCNPEQAWHMANDARAHVVLPVHHQTFVLGREPLTEPIERLCGAAGSSEHDRVGWRSIGETYHWS
jgi:L-ascorbate metabolism protein UlaG (beta-lactamase superfamily)